MTVAELIRELAKYDSGMVVVVDGYEANYDDPHVRLCRVVLDENRDFKIGVFGRHGDGDFSHSGPSTSGVLVSRYDDYD